MKHTYTPTGDEILELRFKLRLSQAACASLINTTVNTWSRWENYKDDMPAAKWRHFTLEAKEIEEAKREQEEQTKPKAEKKYAFELKAEKAEQDRLEAEEKERKYQAMLEKAYQQELQRQADFRPTLEYWKDIVRVKIKNIDEITKAKTEDYDGMVGVAKQLEKFYHDNKAEIDARIEGTWVEPEINTDWLDND